MYFYGILLAQNVDGSIPKPYACQHLWFIENVFLSVSKPVRQNEVLRTASFATKKKNRLYALWYRDVRCKRKENRKEQLRILSNRTTGGQEQDHGPESEIG
jgi:hypothetical protein